MKFNKIVILVVLCSMSLSLFSQKSMAWKAYRKELILGIGVTGFLGDLGGADDIGTEWSPVDLDFNMTRALFSLGYRYKFARKFSGKIGLSYGWLKGADYETKEQAREGRNLQFRSPIVELAGQLEYWIIEDKVLNHYGYSGSSKLKGNKFSLYGFVGVGGFWFNPKGKYQGADGDSKWYALQPLTTEGQGLPDEYIVDPENNTNDPNTRLKTNKKYSRIQIAFPAGFGFKYYMSNKWSIGMEAGLRITLTDYIDDVSSPFYYDFDAYEKPISEGGTGKTVDAKTKYFAYGQYKHEGYNGDTAPGDFRGDDKDNDAYIFTTINLIYRPSKKVMNRPKF